MYEYTEQILTAAQADIAYQTALAQAGSGIRLHVHFARDLYVVEHDDGKVGVCALGRFQHFESRDAFFEFYGCGHSIGAIKNAVFAFPR